MAHSSYLFDLGDSNTGPVGLCVRVCAQTRAEALARVKLRLDAISNTMTDRAQANQYIAFYSNPDHITLKDICAGETERCSCGYNTDSGE